ncbi:MAG: helix-hairpin-helix domain-containing protein [Candidatus Aminicenantales bacterium]
MEQTTALKAALPAPKGRSVVKPVLAGRKLTSLPNIGKTTAAKLEKIGIKTPEDFLARDPYDVFHELKTKVDPTLCRCALAGIIGARTGEPWHKITEKTAAEYERRHPGHKWGPC